MQVLTLPKRPNTHAVGIRSLYKGGKLQDHALVRDFRRWLRGRKPSFILAWAWLHDAEGIILALQYELNPPQPRRPRYQPIIHREQIMAPWERVA